MKRASAEPAVPEPRASVSPSVFVALGAVAFAAALLISPGCERGADATKIGDPEATEDELSTAVQRLCATEQGRTQMTARLESLDRAARAPALELASAQPKCLERIPGALRAEHEIWKEGAQVDDVVAVGAEAIEPALEAASGSDGARRVALGALTALADELSEDQKQRALKRAEPLAASEDAEDARAAKALLVTLGVVPPDEPEADEGDDDFQLGGGGLRLQLGGAPPPAGAPPRPGGGVMLREPTLELKGSPKGGVLFDASKEP
jgi:hypothetical protein